ncbi:hypothetical protein [Paenibacillus polymyxa]|uniref:Uncharacterized protein n=1 Tax=Paenibacillus polymyxa TaxID=1406 RepID=A0ABX2ZDF8_PAEPO|nr:hypothetical protein [Paenibacillus polymyxa]ODA08212.1 hypothetical protein A7312_28015 [Paenibacillus polymyxa]
MEIIAQNKTKKIKVEVGDLLISDSGNHMLVVYDGNSSQYRVVYLEESNLYHWIDDLNDLAIGGRLGLGNIISIVKSKDIKLTLN